jgi:hypothetical protein
MAQHAAEGEPLGVDEEDIMGTVDKFPPGSSQCRVEAQASLAAGFDLCHHAADADDRAALPVDVPPVREDVLVRREPAS